MDQPKTASRASSPVHSPTLGPYHDIILSKNSMAQLTMQQGSVTGSSLFSDHASQPQWRRSVVTTLGCDQALSVFPHKKYLLLLSFDTDYLA